MSRTTRVSFLTQSCLWTGVTEQPVIIIKLHHRIQIPFYTAIIAIYWKYKIKLQERRARRFFQEKLKKQ